jgi:hypothetical protein
MVFYSLLTRANSSKLEKWKVAGMEPRVNFFHLGMGVSAWGDQDTLHRITVCWIWGGLVMALECSYPEG